MSAYMRIAKLHRELAAAYEELESGPPKQRRRRGPVKAETPFSPEQRDRARAVLRRGGLVGIR